tara:strand:+ start:209 stop:388 length:180 start_codon:yes stop_codon:yes gene_type:complete
MIEKLLEDIKKLRNEMVQANWPAQRLSDIILKYEDLLREQKGNYTTEEIIEAQNKILED